METPPPSPQTESISSLWVSVIAQQLLFLFCATFHPSYIFISLFPIFVPIVLIWALALTVPLIYVRPISAGIYLRKSAKEGWLFVGTAFAWIILYCALAEADGTPVSAYHVRKYYELRLEREIQEIKGTNKAKLDNGVTSEPSGSGGH
ncbi:hypothetical protein BH09VER1_BH09VER1_55790 [soil metagenome]